MVHFMAKVMDKAPSVLKETTLLKMQKPFQYVFILVNVRFHCKVQGNIYKIYLVAVHAKQKRY